MGVMPCHRKNCDNILCRTYVPNVGTICSDCQLEFKSYLSCQKNVFIDSKQSIIAALKKFMDTERGEFEGKNFDVYEFFKEYTSE